MRTQPIPLPRGDYFTPAFAMQMMVNLRWQPAETAGPRSPEMLQTLPGLRPFVEVA